MKDDNVKSNFDPDGEDKNLDLKITELLDSVDRTQKPWGETDVVLTKVDLKRKRIPLWEYILVLIALMLIIGIGIMINTLG